MESKIAWTVACVNEFAYRFEISVKAAFQYLYNHGGIAFLEEHYEAEHLLSFDDASRLRNSKNTCKLAFFQHQ